MRLRIILILLSWMLIGSAGAQDHAAMQLGDRELGEPLARTEDNADFDCSMPAATGFDHSCKARRPQALQIGAVALQMFTLHFAAQRLVAVEAKFSQRRFAAVEKALSQNYGEATVEIEKLRAGMGGTFENSIDTWQRGDALLRLEQFFRNINDSSLILTTAEHMSKLVIPKQTNARTGIKDL